MGSFSIWHWLIVLAIIVLIFGGGGKIPKLMRDMGQGITAFKRGMKEDKDKVEGDTTTTSAPSSVTHQDKAAS
jgi:sec-independent protein translocase protein TatA